jgi:hypothetical protein
VGGVYSRDDVAAVVREDAVVAAHYRDVDRERLRPAVISEPRDVYVSYRVGHRVFWTSHTVRLAAGETVLTDGINQIRARCGNRISAVPRQPVSGVEPFVAEFDESRDPRGDSSTSGERDVEAHGGVHAAPLVPFLTAAQESIAVVGPGATSVEEIVGDAVSRSRSIVMILPSRDPETAPTVWGNPVVPVPRPGLVVTGTGGDGSTGGTPTGGGTFPTTDLDPGGVTTGDAPAVPEPGLVVMMAVGVAAAAFRRRR